MQFGRKAMVSGALLAVAITGGALGASVVGTAQAQSSGASGDAAATAPDPPSGPHTANGITETLLTGDTATSVTKAAQDAVPGATIDRVETDAEGAAYEAHVTKSDGSHATVKLDADFHVTSVEDGMR